MTDTYHVIAILESKPEHQESMLQALQTVATESRKEPTNISYEVYQSKQNPAQFSLVETWTSAMDHEKQFTKSYIEEFITQATPWFAKPYTHFTGYQAPQEKVALTK